MPTRNEFSYIYGAARTPIGKFNGSLSALSAPELGGIAIRKAVKRSGIPAERISEAIMGNVLSAGVGQAPARQAAVKGGLPYGTGATTVNKVCGSGLKAVMFADDSIRLGQSEFVVAGGMESMSRVPYLLPNARSGYKLGDATMIDGMVHDGLCDTFTGCHMGELVERLKYDREAQDRFAEESYRRARKAQDDCLFSAEIVGVTVTRDGRQVLVDKDEQPYANDLQKLRKLPLAFMKNGGTVTAGNASKLNDGAAALVLGAYDESLKPLARVVCHATHSEAPELFPVAPVGAIEKILRKWDLKLQDIDLFEINEAFAVSMLAVRDRLSLNMEKVNVNGGAVALGHPLGASGARILVTLIYALKQRNLRRGVAAICLGGGEAVALGVEIVEG